MAVDAKLSQITAATSVDGRHSVYGINQTPVEERLYLGTLNVLPDGFMLNGKLSVTVASNNITVALKTKSGANPSATDPVSVWINGTQRQCTATLSVTKNAGTNWFSSGSTPTAAKEIDYFAYLIWNTTPGTDIVDIGFARIAHGRVYSDFSGTTTNEKYLAFANASTPTSTDDCVVIGRFAATLSATASFNWSVPTYTNVNMINYPIWNTRRLSWEPSPTGYSAVPTSTVYEYVVNSNFVSLCIREAANGTSNATTTAMTAPFTAVTLTNGSWLGLGSGLDNTAALTTACRLDISSASATIQVYPNMSAGSTWTASGGKRLAIANLSFPIG